MPNTEFCFQGKGISIREPWASAIAFGGKNIENRSRRTHYRGPIAIHASATFHPEDLERECRRDEHGATRPLRRWIELGMKRFAVFRDDAFPWPGHILAIAMIVDCVDHSSSPWFSGAWGFVIEGVVPIEPIRWRKGKLSLWDCAFRYRPLSLSKVEI